MEETFSDSSEPQAKVQIEEIETIEAGLVVSTLDNAKEGLKALITNMKNEWSSQMKSLKSLDVIVKNQATDSSFHDVVTLLAKEMIRLSQVQNHSTLLAKDIPIKHRRIYVNERGNSTKINLHPPTDGEYHSIVGINATYVSNDTSDSLVFSLSPSKEIEANFIKSIVCGDIELVGDIKTPENERKIIAGVIPAGSFVAEGFKLLNICDDDVKNIKKNIHKYMNKFTYVELDRFLNDVDILDGKEKIRNNIRYSYQNVFVGIKSSASQLRLLLQTLGPFILDQLKYKIELGGDDKKAYPVAIPVWLLAALYHASQLYNRIVTMSFDTKHPLSLEVEPLRHERKSKEGTFGAWITVHYISYPKLTHI